MSALNKPTSQLFRNSAHWEAAAAAAAVAATITHLSISAAAGQKVLSNKLIDPQLIPFQLASLHALCRMYRWMCLIIVTTLSWPLEQASFE
jgi:hypothetical protein